MLKNKRIFKVIVLLILLVMGMTLLTGCGKNEQSSVSKGEEVETENYEEPIKNYFKGMEKADAEIYLSAFPEFMDYEYDDDDMEDLLYALEDEYGEDIKITYKIKENEEYEKEDLEYVQEYIYERYDEEVKVTSGYNLKVTATVEGDDDEDTDSSNMYVYKIDGEWKYFGVSPETAKTYLD